MLTGLVTTCMVTLLACASWYQRRTRHGWVDELDLVRGDALTAPGGEMATAVAIGEAIDARDRQRGVNASWDVRGTTSTGVDSGAGDELLRSTAEHGDTETSDSPRTSTDDEFGPLDGEADTDAEALFDSDIWTQPSPHPIRPSEMWHSAAGPSALFRDGVSLDPGHTTGSEVDASRNRRRFPRFRPVTPSSPDAAGEIEARETAAPFTPEITDRSLGGMLSGAVARRRTTRSRPSLTYTAGPLRARPQEGAQDRSPLPEARLGPLRPPRRPVQQSPAGTGDTDPVSSGAMSSGAEAGAEVTVEPEPASIVVPPGAPVARSLDERYEVALGSTVLRFNEGHRTSLCHLGDGPEVVVAHGWCWVTALGTGPIVPVRIGLPSAELVVAAGGRALAMVEDDGSAFLVVIEGSAQLVRTDEATSLSPGLIVLLANDGTLQVDQAERSEVEADPVVARNLGFDATS